MKRVFFLNFALWRGQNYSLTIGQDKRENEDTENSTEWWKNVFKKWANERNLQVNLEEYENDVLDQRLSQF